MTMMFLAVLIVATALAALIDRRDRRTIARRGMAIALAFAGISHLVMPTPFEQHLPGWVPAAGLLVAVTGLIELALGAALLVAPGPPRSKIRRAVGWGTAAYLIAVVPANVYVAVAGVDVDGQPGGIYAWLRLPFQVLFVAWVLWSTADPRPVVAPGTPDLPKLRVPWAYGPAGRRAVLAAAGNRVVMASRLELRRWRDVPAFLVAALRLRALLRRSPGALALSLRAAPASRAFWTLSVWENHDALRAYAAHERHVRVMRRFAPVMANSTFADWSTSAAGLPNWSDGAAAIAAATCPADLNVVTEGQPCASPS
jgi:uncharacterized membrane protein